MSPAAPDLMCGEALPTTARLDLLVAGMLRLRPSTRRRILDDHRVVSHGRDRVLWRGESLSQRAVADALAARAQGMG